MSLYTAKPYIDEKICNDVVSVLKSGMLVQGPKVKELEEKFSKKCNVNYCAAVNSGTAALHSALFSAGIQLGDEVITTPFTFVATANSILMVGAKPVFVDIDEKTFNMDPDEIEKKIIPKTKAILPVHLYGLMSDMEKIIDIAKKYNLIVIEDAAQAHDAEIKGKKAGSIGDIGAFSLYATKNMMSAEGGLVTSNKEDFIEKVKSFRHHGQSLNGRYNYISFGYNYRMTDILAVIGLNQLEKLEEFNTIRRRNAKLYDGYLNEIEGITTPYVPQGYKHVYHQYTIKINHKIFGHSREELISKLNSNDIFPAIFYPQPLHLISTFRRDGFKEGDFPIAEKISSEVLSLPVHPGIKENDVEKVYKVIKNLKGET
jgi:dTDP-4-amino-4,6-dideoxygalactose transaminase